MPERKYGCDYHITFRQLTKDDADMLNQFDCGNDGINNFIQNESLSSSKDVTYTFIDEDSNNIIAFCAIRCTGISVNETDGRETYITSYPAVEIDFFAVDDSYRSIPLYEGAEKYDTLSSAMFLFMISKIKQISSTVIGANNICLYAVPQAVTFYERCGFTEFEPYMWRDEAPFTQSCVPMFVKI